MTERTNSSSRNFPLAQAGGGPGEKLGGLHPSDPTRMYKIQPSQVRCRLLDTTCYAECVLGRKTMLLRINGVASEPPVGRLSAGALCVMEWMERRLDLAERLLALEAQLLSDDDGLWGIVS